MNTCLMRGLGLAIAICFVFVMPAHAEPVELYTIEVPVDPADPDMRQNAYTAALERALIRVTGADSEQHRASLRSAFPDAGRYVLRFQPGPDDTLVVTFDGEAIERRLRETRHAIWSADRPTTLVWLAVDWGDGEREILGTEDTVESADAPRSTDRNRVLRERVETIAEWRGIPVVFPLMDMQDLESVSFSDIWGGFDEPLVEASLRYGVNSVLIGRVKADGSQPNRWTYFSGEQRMAWDGEPEVVVSMLADELAAQFAISGDAELESFVVRIDGVDSVSAFGQVEQMLAGLGVLENFALNRATGPVLEYRVSVYGGIDRLSKALELSGVIEPQYVVPGDAMSRVPDANMLTFQYRN